MALRFFRRRQKLMIFLMVLLMVVFLMSSAMQNLFGPKRRRGGRQIAVEAEVDAPTDLRVLGNLLGIGQSERPRPGAGLFAAFMERSDVPVLHWSLLVDEAHRMGFGVTEKQVDDFLAALGLEGQTYDELLDRLAESGYTEKMLRWAVANYLLVTESFSASMLAAEPSMPELRNAFRDMNERIQLAMVILPVENFLKDVEKPPLEKVKQWFEDHKEFFRAHPDNQTRYGFGYRLPDRLDVAYLFMDMDLVGQAVEPTEEQMLEYWRRNRGRMSRKVELPAPATQPASKPAASAPATGPSTAPAGETTTQPAEPQYREVVIERYSEARDTIREILRPEVAGAKMTELLNRADELIALHGKDAGAYAKAAAAMLRPADALLRKPVTRLPVGTRTLEVVIRDLQSVTGVNIIYPFGEHGTWTLDGKIKVKVDPEWRKDTLGEVLAKISAAHEYPKFEWVTCEGFESAIFPSSPVKLVPISAGRTGMISFNEVMEHELLGMATLTKTITERPQTLALIANSAKEFQGPEPRQAPLVEVGGDFRPALHLAGGRSGRLLWRLVAAERAHTPKELTDEIRSQVEDDLKIVSAMEKALAAAGDMKKKLDAGEELDKIAKADKQEVIRTELFSRMAPTVMPWTRQIVITYSDVEGIGRSKEFIDKVFELVPEDPEPPHTGRPVAVAPLYRRRKVVLAQRVGYEPAVRAEFEEAAPRLARMLTLQRNRRELTWWFDGKSITQRLSYVETRPEE